MQYKLTAPRLLKANVQLPASKSISNRVLILRALSEGNQPLNNLSDCDDTQVMLNALRNHPDTIDIQAAGTAMRFLTAYLSVTPGEHTLTGTERMRHRPIRLLVDALHTLGADIEYVGEEGYPPLRIRGGELTGNEVTLAGDVSSQYISALLMMGAALPHGLLLHLTGDIISRPYIDLTLQLMRQFGACWKWMSPTDIRVEHGYYRELPYTVESDWSAASYWYEIMALAPRNAETANEVVMLGLQERSSQGDRRCAELFKKLGVQTEFLTKKVRLKAGGELAQTMEEDLSRIPDLAQTFVVTCCLLGIPFRFSGLQSLRIKETDRLSALIAELRKLGYLLHSEGDSVLAFTGERCEPDAEPIISTYEDHRMAMAFAPTCMVHPWVKIDNPHVVSKSYPKYWDDLHRAGFNIDVII